jgi:hypothetical protein
MLGRFLEFSVQTNDIIDSLGFYKLLGFHELEIGDVLPHRYAVISDGELCIGLHDRSAEDSPAGPALTFVHQDLAHEARSMSDHGFDFNYLQLDEDAFNELGFQDPDNNMIAMIEARTFSPPDEGSAGAGSSSPCPPKTRCEVAASGRRLRLNYCACARSRRHTCDLMPRACHWD